VTMIYIFAIQLVSKRTLQGLVERLKGSRVVFGALITLISLVTVVAVFLKNKFIDMAVQMPDEEVSMNVIGNTLMGSEKYQYVLPFEFISVFLLACIIGGIVISRKE
jgi:NADH:ubiquinone oxidoreductase subunit 6 (subunit J)